ncbi:aromatic ring-hydroxylating oxygenase subunit alpha [Sphingorhabdus sp. M41]|uniref:aromatic ring-hydroxylating oxygenase subunit alpha n=1 Tax=Sphingorhabdus sp. M41 TaxID=1806885 RepID=UPI0018D33217|nr:aromatic ring-hydroxylating dioxygenase subunit alpha [Sphingorhabdus sp. M41]
MRCEPHPISGAVYQEVEGGKVRVEDKQRNKSGLFEWDGTWIEGDLTQADIHFLRYIGGPTMRAEKDIFWSVMPPTPEHAEQISAKFKTGSGRDAQNVSSDEDKGQSQQRPKIIAPYVPDPGQDTEEGKRSAAYVPQEYFVENDRKLDLVPEVYKKSAPYPGGPKKVPVGRFHEQRFHDLEVEHIWKKCWQMACRADDIPEVGDHILYKIADLEYIVTRTGENEFKAYANACPHRGRRICERDGKKAAMFRCPFHGWSWGIDGKMKELTCEWDFPDIRETDGDLTEARVAHWAGFIFINPDPDGESFEDYAGPEMLEHYKKNKLENRYKMLHVGKVIKANWKLMQEAFLEAYHSIATHPQLLLQGGDLAETRYDVFGNWGRLGHINASGSSPQRGMILPKERTLDIFRMMADYNAEYLRSLIGDEVEEYSDIELIEQTFNNLFPNFSPWGGWARIVYRFRPHGDNPDECILDTMLLAPWPKDKPKPPAAKLQMIDPDEPWVSCEDLGTLARIFDQDTANITEVHKGLKTKNPPHVIYGAYQESIIRAFHDRYEQRLGLKEGE